ncbi:MAG: DNA polymerase I [Acidobacteriota bacterium]
MSEARRLYLVDGTANIFRAYYALQGLSTRSGLPTNATYGFTTMLRKLLQDERPDYLGVAFDLAAPTFRHKEYGEYKAHRPPPPDDLVVQIPYVKRVCEVLRVPVLEREGYEADDLIGTLARQASERGFEVVIVTIDKDMLQLVDERVNVLNPHKGIRFDPLTVEKVFGVRPDQVVDVLSLWGDASDNVPGVPGIGEKGAKEIIRRFGTLEAALASADQVERKSYRAGLKNHSGEARLSQRLVTIDRQAPVELDLEAMRAGEPDHAAAVELFKELEFSSLVEAVSPSARSVPADYKVVRDTEELDRILVAIRDAGRVSFDLETDSVDPMRARIVGIALATRPRSACYVPVGHRSADAGAQLSLEEALGRLRGVLEDPQIAKIGQNVKYEIVCLGRHGLRPRGIAFDTMVASYLVNPSRRTHNLDDLALEYLNYKTIPYEEVAGRGAKQVTLDQVGVERVCTYACEDADVALQLMEVLDRRLHEAALEELFETLEMPLIEVLADMEATGVRIDVDFLAAMSKQLQAEAGKLEREILDTAGEQINLNSPKQLGVLLFEKMKIKPLRRTQKSKAYSTDQEVLEELSRRHPIAQKILEYRTLTKLRSTYVDALPALVNPDTGRVHTSFNQTVTATGRLSSSDPNLQNIPIRTEVGRRIRRAFIPAEGCVMMVADYSQIELRVLAHMADDPEMVSAFQRGEDIHVRTAAEIFGVADSLVSADMRRAAKAINFGILYGMGPQRLARDQGIPLSQAQGFIRQYFERFPCVKEYIDDTIARVEREYRVTTLLNRVRYFPELRNAHRGLRQQILRQAVNTTIQGTAADLIKRAMLRLHHRLRQEGLRSRMILQVHDELVLEVPEGEVERVGPMVRTAMEGAYPMRAPLKADLKTGRNWMEAG